MMKLRRGDTVAVHGIVHDVDADRLVLRGVGKGAERYIFASPSDVASIVIPHFEVGETVNYFPQDSDYHRKQHGQSGKIVAIFDRWLFIAPPMLDGPRPIYDDPHLPRIWPAAECVLVERGPDYHEDDDMPPPAPVPEAPSVGK